MKKILYAGLMVTVFTGLQIHAMEEPIAKKQKVDSQAVAQSSVFALCSDNKLVEVNPKVIRWSKTIKDMLPHAMEQDGGRQITLPITSEQLNNVTQFVECLTQHNVNALNKKPDDATVVGMALKMHYLLNSEFVNVLKQLDLLGSPFIKAVVTTSINKNQEIGSSLGAFLAQDPQLKSQLPAIMAYACCVDNELKKDSALYALYDEISKGVTSSLIEDKEQKKFYRNNVHLLQRAQSPKITIDLGIGHLKIITWINGQKQYQKIAPMDPGSPYGKLNRHVEVAHVDKKGESIAFYDKDAKCFYRIDLKTDNITAFPALVSQTFPFESKYSPDNKWVLFTWHTNGHRRCLNLQTGEYVRNYDPLGGPAWLDNGLLIKNDGYENGQAVSSLYDIREVKDPVSGQTRQILYNIGKLREPQCRANVMDLFFYANDDYVVHIMKPNFKASEKGKYIIVPKECCGKNNDVILSGLWYTKAAQLTRHYFNNQINLEQFLLLKKIAQAKHTGKPCTLTESEKKAFAKIMSDLDPICAKIIDGILKKYIKQ